MSGPEQVVLWGIRSDQDEQVRGGALLVLCGWAFFVAAGAVFAKFSEHWDIATPKIHRSLPNDAYSVVQWGAEVGGLLVLIAALVALPPFVRLIRSGGWAKVSRPVLRALVSGVIAFALTGGIVVWAHHLSSHNRNGGLLIYGLAVLAWALVLVATLVAATAAALAVAHNIVLSHRSVALIGWLAMALTVVMVAVAGGMILWWIEVAEFSPGVLGGGPLATGNVLPPGLVGAAILMMIGLAAAAFGVFRIGRWLTPNQPR